MTPPGFGLSDGLAPLKNLVFSKDFFMTPLIRRALVCPLFLALAFGCSSKGNPNAPAKVSGEVTYKGQKLPSGSVTFHPTKGAPIRAPIGADGGYSATDLPAEDMQVTIETDSAKPPVDPTKQGYGGGRQMRMSPGPKDKSAAPQATYVKIPDKYGNKNRSGLTAKLVPGHNTVNFDLD